MSSRAEGLKPPAPTKSRLSPLAGCGKTRLRACFGKGTSLLVPICPLLLSFRGGFSRRGICFSEFFRNLLELRLLQAGRGGQREVKGTTKKTRRTPPSHRLFYE